MQQLGVFAAALNWRTETLYLRVCYVYHDCALSGVVCSVSYVCSFLLRSLVLAFLDADSSLSRSISETL